jgi:tRNA(fMet)-specific endonuclease VapC
MKVLDTSFLIDLLRGKPETKKIAESGIILLTTQINMYEILVGLFHKGMSNTRFQKAQELFETIRVLSLDDNGIIKSARISGELMKKGQIIEDCDCLTAGIALSKGFPTIITKNVKHFERIKNIKVETY